MNIDTKRLDALAAKYVRSIAQVRPYMSEQELVYFWQQVSLLAAEKAPKLVATKKEV